MPLLEAQGGLTVSHCLPTEEGRHGGTKMTNDRYLAQLFDEDGDPVNYDNQVIDASNDQDAISKAGEWAASHRLGMVAMLIVKQGFRGVHSRKVYLGA